MKKKKTAVTVKFSSFSSCVSISYDVRHMYLFVYLSYIISIPQLQWTLSSQSVTVTRLHFFSVPSCLIFVHVEENCSLRVWLVGGEQYSFIV